MQLHPLPDVHLLAAFSYCSESFPTGEQEKGYGIEKKAKDVVFKNMVIEVSIIWND